MESLLSQLELLKKSKNLFLTTVFLFYIVGINSCIKKEKQLYYDYKIPPVHNRLKLYFG